jgi:hypothetical protein
VFLIIVGIDECDKRREILCELNHLANGTVNIFIASRPEKDIQEAFRGKPTVVMDKYFVQKDIATHLDWVLTNEFEFQLDEKLKEEIRSEMLNESEGM